MKISLADLLSVTTGVLLSHDMGGVYRTLGFLTGDSLMTHQLPAACEAMRPVLLEQLPWLVNLVPPQETTTEELLAWLDSAGVEYGAEFEVSAAPADIWGEHDPVRDLIDMVGANKKVIAVVLPDADGAR